MPEAACEARSKGEIALSELDRLRAAGVRFGAVLADAGYGSSAAFRRALDERGLRFAVGILCTQKVYAPTSPSCRRPAAHAKLIPDQDPRTVEAVLDERPWRRVTWRQGTKGPSVRSFLGPAGAGRRWSGLRQQTAICRAQRSGSWASGAPRANASYYLSNLPARITRRALVGAIKARWVCEQAHQQLKEELGPRPLRGPLLDRAASPCADDVPGVCLPAA